MTKDLLFILIALIVSAILGYFIGRRTSSGSSKSDGGNTSNEGDLKKQINQLQRDLKDCEDRSRKLAASNTATAAGAAGVSGGSASSASSSASLTSGGSDSSTSTGTNSGSMNNGSSTADAASTKVENFDNSAAKEAMGKPIKADDLKIVEGIGPKIESILKDNNIMTWKMLADADPEVIRKILVDYGGDGYKIHDPSTWPKQAQMAFEGHWEKLADYQDRLKGGREV